MRRSIEAPGIRRAAWATLCLLGALGTASAKERESTVIVVEGPGADAISGWIEDRWGGPETAEEEQAFRGALRARGALPLHVAVGSPARDARLVACVHAAAGAADVDGAILVDLDRTPGATRIHVWKVDTRHGGAVVESDVTLPASASVLDASRAILTIAPPPPRAARAAVEPTRSPAPVVMTTDATPAPDKVASTAQPDRDASLFALQAAMGVGTRHFSYVDRVTPSLRPYDLAAAPVASLAAVVYPMGFTHAPVLRDFGIAGDYAQAFAVSSEDSTGAHVGTTWQSFDVGAVQRFRVTRALGASVSGGYGGNDFHFDQNLAGGAAVLPSVAYRFVRVGADLRVTFLSAFSAFGGGSYLDILSTGYPASLFPRESVGGVEGHLGASYALARSWELSVGASYTRVFYSVNPVPGDSGVAGGALDEQTRIQAGLVYVM